MSKDEEHALALSIWESDCRLSLLPLTSHKHRSQKASCRAPNRTQGNNAAVVTSSNRLLGFKAPLRRSPA